MKVIVVKKKSKGFDIPDEGVILWYGSSSEVPSGYAIYTDLNGYFPYGGSTKDLTARGASTHVHTYPSTAVSWNSGHTHTVTNDSVGNASAENIGYNATGSSASPGHSHSVSGNVTSSGAHRHTLGSTGSGTSIPQHKKLYYIKAVA